MFVDSFGVVFPQGHMGDRVLSQQCTSTGEMEIFIRPEGVTWLFITVLSREIYSKFRKNRKYVSLCKPLLATPLFSVHAQASRGGAPVW